MHPKKTLWARASCAKNWTLWSVWDSSFLDFTQPNLCRHGREDFKSIINAAFQKYRLDERGWKPLKGDNFIVLRVSEQDIEEKYRPYTQEIQLDAHLILYEQVKDAQSLQHVKSFPVNFLACAGLAEIFNAVVGDSDILVLSGGYDTIRCRDNPGIPLFGLNFNKEHHTQILRIPGNLFGELALYERVEPLDEDKLFRFMYMVERDRFHRIVEQTRKFAQDEFCRKVTDTFAYSRSRWDFPVPIVRTAKVHSLYELLCSPKFKMISPKPSWSNDNESQKPSWSNEDESHSDDSSLHKYQSGKLEQKWDDETFQTSKIFLEGAKRRRARIVQHANGRRFSSDISSTSSPSSSCGCLSVLCLLILTIMLSLIGAILVINWLQAVCPMRLNGMHILRN